MLTKATVEANIASKVFSLRKKSITVKDVESNKIKRSAVWLYISEIFPVPVGQPIEKKHRAIRGWVCAPDSAVLSKQTTTSNLINYLGKCKSIPLNERMKWFPQGVARNNRLKRGREEPNTKTLLNYGIQLSTKKKLRIEDKIGRSSIEKDVAKIIAESVSTAQLRMNNEGLLPFSLHDKPSFMDFCQTLVYAGSKVGMNLDVGEFLLSGHRIAEKNIEEFKVLFKEKQPEVKKAATRKCLNFQVDM